MQSYCRYKKNFNTKGNTENRSRLPLQDIGSIYILCAWRSDSAVKHIEPKYHDGGSKGLQAGNYQSKSLLQDFSNVKLMQIYCRGNNHHERQYIKLRVGTDWFHESIRSETIGPTSHENVIGRPLFFHKCSYRMPYTTAAENREWE